MAVPFDRPGSGLMPPPDNLVVPEDDGTVSADVAVIGSGMGGSTIAHALRDSGLDVLVVERGEFLPREIENGLRKQFSSMHAIRTVNSGTPRTARRLRRGSITTWAETRNSMER
jgi:choline dehydrogenase-like flavoprotein